MENARIPPTGRRPETGLSSVPLPLWILVGINAAIELALSANDAGMIGQPGVWRMQAMIYGAFWLPLVDGTALPVFEAQPVTMFVTYAFLHGDFVHMAMNMVAVLVFGKLMCGAAGLWRTLASYGISILGGAVGFALLASSPGPMAGASGAVFGLIGLWIGLEFEGRRRQGASLQPLWGRMAALMIANVLMYVMLEGLLAWEAHLGGFVAGWLSGLLWIAIARRGAARRGARRE